LENRRNVIDQYLLIDYLSINTAYCNDITIKAAYEMEKIIINNKNKSKMLF